MFDIIKTDELWRVATKPKIYLPSFSGALIFTEQVEMEVYTVEVQWLEHLWDYEN